MKVLLLGATGRTGKLILNELLRRGHSVNALVRDKSKVITISASLTVFEGSTIDPAMLDKAMQNCEAIIGALNISRNSDFPWSALRTPKQLMSATMEGVIPLAQKHQINRVIVISAWGVAETEKDIPWWFKWTIENSNIKYGYHDHERQEDLLAKTDLNWTAIRPVGLTNFGLKHVQVSIANSPKPSILISRHSVASFTVDVLEQNLYIKQAPAIFN
jgi:putative NADH-flavin reductase